MAEKEKSLPIKAAENTALGATLFGASTVALDYGKELSKFKDAKKFNTKKSDEFIKTLKRGDIILEAQAPELRVESIFANETKPKKTMAQLIGNTKVKLDSASAVLIDKNLRNASFDDLAKLGGGGSRYTHASIYLGDGKVAEMTGAGAKIESLDKRMGGKNFIAMSVTNDTSVGRKIGDSAEEIVKSGAKYRSGKDLVNSSIKKNLTFIGKKFDGKFTCTEYVEEAVSRGKGKGSFINKFRVSPTDILLSKDTKIIKSLNFSTGTNKEKLLNFAGKTFKNGKFIILGAGIGAATALGVAAYKKVKDKKGSAASTALNVAGSGLILSQTVLAHKNARKKYKSWLSSKSKSTSGLSSSGKYSYKSSSSSDVKTASTSGFTPKIEGSLSGAAAVKAYKSGQSGRWITYNGRKLFIRNLKGKK